MLASGGRPAVDSGLVRRLVDSQFPEWRGLSLRVVEPGGSDHLIHRLGESLSVRLPRHSGAIRQAEKELTWLPRLGSRLPLAVPEPVAVGQPGEGYPWHWGVSRWRNGEVATVAEFGESHETAVLLGGFLTALQACELPSDDDRDGLGENFLIDRDAITRDAIAASPFDAAAMTKLWDEALAAEAWSGPPVWFHGDFHTGNLLSENGRVTAVIDFGGLGIGDPSRDLMMAFTLMSRGPRATFRKSLAIDDATWARGRGWALTAGLVAHAAYAQKHAHIAAATGRQIEAALEG
jgi:aminoglycoside phosphotransferase (APT) family kinase protein